MRHDVKSLQAMGVNTGHIAVLLDGADVTRDPGPIVGFDTQEGYIERYRRGPDGRVAVEDDRFVVDVIHGRVEAYLLRDSGGTWPHALPEPDGPRVLLSSVRR